MKRVIATVKDQRVLFLIVGGFNSAMGLVYFTALQLLLGHALGYMVVLVLAYAVATISAYLLHRYIVFRVRGRFWLDLGRFSLVQVGALLLNAIILPLLVEVAGLEVLPAQFIAFVVTVSLTYLAHKLFSFRRRTDAPAQRENETEPFAMDSREQEN